MRDLNSTIAYIMRIKSLQTNNFNRFLLTFLTVTTDNNIAYLKRIYFSLQSSALNSASKLKLYWEIHIIRVTIMVSPYISVEC